MLTLDVRAMDIAPTSTALLNSTAPKSPEPETETPTRIQPKFSNGVLKRHNQVHHHHHAPPIVVIYKECLKNHAATIGGHALDGCGEFMPSPISTPTDPTSLKCAACGCHRNFHRREPEDPLITTTATIEYQSHHRHHPPPPSHRSPNSSSPPPISSAFYPSAPQMLLALSGGTNPNSNLAPNLNLSSGGGANSKKRFRTKFSQIQKEKMLQFADRIGWKIQKRDEDLIQEFCNEIGVDRGVLKVWMHNNKNTLAKRDLNGGVGGHSNNNGHQHHHDESHENNNMRQNLNHHFESDSGVAHVAVTNGSSSSS